MIRKRNSKYNGGVKTKITCICLKKKHALAFNLTQLARFPYKSEREPIKLQSLYKLINHHAVIKRLFHHQTGNLRQLKKTNYETIKDHDLQNEYQFRRPSISLLPRRNTVREKCGCVYLEYCHHNVYVFNWLIWNCKY